MGKRNWSFNVVGSAHGACRAGTDMAAVAAADDSDWGDCLAPNEV